MTSSKVIPPKNAARYKAGEYIFREGAKTEADLLAAINFDRRPDYARNNLRSAIEGGWLKQSSDGRIDLSDRAREHYENNAPAAQPEAPAGQVVPAAIRQSDAAEGLRASEAVQACGCRGLLVAGDAVAPWEGVGMSEPFKAGEIVVWQNCTGKYAYLNGTETQITGGLAGRPGIERGWVICYRTNTIGDHGTPLLALPFELRRRKPPTTGEQSVLALFKSQPQAVPA